MLHDLTGGDDDLAEAILGDYVDALAVDLAALRASVAESDAGAVRRHAHRINGASRTVGARDVTTVAERLEAAASRSVEDWPSLRSLAAELERVVAEVDAALSRATVSR